MLTTTRLFVVLLCQGPFSTNCNVRLKTRANRTVSSIECSSLFNIQFYFKTETSNNERLIAECDHSLQGCYLVDGSGEHFAVSWTKNGGEIIIKDNENARGRYTCCEALDNRTCSSTEIGPSNKETSTLTTERNVVYINYNYYGVTPSPESGGNNSFVIGSFTTIVLLLLVLLTALIWSLHPKGRITSLCPMCFQFCRRKSSDSKVKTTYAKTFEKKLEGPRMEGYYAVISENEPKDVDAPERNDADRQVSYENSKFFTKRGDVSVGPLLDNAVTCEQEIRSFDQEKVHCDDN